MNQEMSTQLKLFFQTFVISCVRNTLQLHLLSTWGCFCCAITLLVVSQGTKTWKLNAAVFWSVIAFESCCTVFLGKMISKIISWYSREIGSLWTIQKSDTAARFVSRYMWLPYWSSPISTSNLSISVQSRHCWRFSAILSKQKNLKK